MHTITTAQITSAIAQKCQKLNNSLPANVEKALREALCSEKTSLGKSVLKKLLKNFEIARQKRLPICQDTGTVIVFAELGQFVQIKGGSFYSAINRGIAQGYKQLRKSIVADPLKRLNTKNNTPAVIHTQIVPGKKLTLTLLAKGGGAENKSRLKMFTPNASLEEIKQFTIETVRHADAAACPPLIIGIGIGGTFDSCALLAKKALLRKIGSRHPIYGDFEQKILTAINQTGIGPAGYGGSITALSVQIETAPCHIASLPVAVNLQCHADRYLKIVI